MITKTELYRRYDEFVRRVEKEKQIELKTPKQNNPFFIRKNTVSLDVFGPDGAKRGSLARDRLYKIATGKKIARDKQGHPFHAPYFYGLLDELKVDYPPYGYREDNKLTYTGAINISSNRKRKDEQRITQYVQDLEIGQVGEAIALKIVHEKWDKKHYTIKDVSEEKSPNGIYDIQVKEKKTGKIIAAIEVKSTTGRRDTDFFLTENEKKAWKHYKDKYYIYRIYELQLTSKPTYKYHVIDNEQLRAAYHLSVKDYTVSRLENKQK